MGKITQGAEPQIQQPLQDNTLFQHQQHITQQQKDINSKMGSCHSCKTRREMYFICPTNRYHKFCERCFRKYTIDIVCPICYNLCECASCKRLSSLKHSSSK